MKREDLVKNVEKLSESRSKLAQELETSDSQIASLVAQQNEDLLALGESGVTNTLATARARAEALRDAVKFADGELDKARFALDEYTRQEKGQEAAAIAHQLPGVIAALQGDLQSVKSRLDTITGLILQARSYGPLLGGGQDARIYLDRLELIARDINQTLQAVGDPFSNLEKAWPALYSKS